jgi:DNA polymerase III alpha subunit
MNYDDYGQIYCSSKDLCDLIYKDPDIKIENFLVEDPEIYNNSIRLFHADLPKLTKYTETNHKFNSIEEFDKFNQSNWFMPDSYKNLDIAEYVLNLCKTNDELERVEEELVLYQERNLFNLLRFLKYLTDTLRLNKIVWGVGRGSSVSSYVLFLLGVHKINSIRYDLDIKEFLK